MKLYKIKLIDIMFLVFAVFLFGLSVGAYLSPNFMQEKKVQISVAGSRMVEMGIPAVDSEGNGVVGKLITTIRPGSGQVLVNVNNVLAQFDTQLSGRTAAIAASKYTNTDLSNLDIIYDIHVNASVIEGPSAGAAMATSILLGIENVPQSDKIMMTGTINEDGTIGPVGAIEQKARAAKEAGAKIFLTPKNQGTELKPIRIRECTTVGITHICRIKYNYEKVDIGSSLNITLKEVENLGEILEIFRSQSSNPNTSV